MLMTLPLRELRNGYAEIIKAAAIADAALFEELEMSSSSLQGVLADDAAAPSPTGSAVAATPSSPPPEAVATVPEVARRAADPALAADTGISATSFGSVFWLPGTRDVMVPPTAVRAFPNWHTLFSVVSRAIAIKCEVVSGDEREGGKRVILNWGHTVGHAIEAMMAPTLLHGECVAIGMLIESAASRAMGYMDTSTLHRLSSVIEAFGLPTRMPPELRKHPALRTCMRFMAVDKKNDSVGSVATIKIVLVDRVGSVAGPTYTHKLSQHLLGRLLAPSVHVSVGKKSHDCVASSSAPNSPDADGTGPSPSRALT
ncbi:hypothetical protein EON62_06380, partial [archaeon]